MFYELPEKEMAYLLHRPRGTLCEASPVAVSKVGFRSRPGVSQGLHHPPISTCILSCCCLLFMCYCCLLFYKHPFLLGIFWVWGLGVWGVGLHAVGFGGSGLEVQGLGLQNVRVSATK